MKKCIFFLPFFFLSVFCFGQCELPEELPYNPTDLDEANAQIASCYAPVIHHLAQSSLPYSVNGRADLLLAVNYDGNWNTGDNWENLQQFDGANGIGTEDYDELDPKVYYSVVWTDIAWVVTYGFYHPRDYSLSNGACCIGSYELGKPGDSHENDFEVVIVVVSRIHDNGINKFQVVGGYATPHGRLNEYPNINSIPEVYIDDRTHAPLLNLNDNESIDYDELLYCDTRIAVSNPHITYVPNVDPEVSPFVEIEGSYPHNNDVYVWGFGEYELDDIFGNNTESLQSKRFDAEASTFMNGGNTFYSENGPAFCPPLGGGASAPWGQGAIDYSTSTIQDIVCRSMYSIGTSNCLNSPPVILSNPYYTPSCVSADQLTLIATEDMEISAYNSSQPFERIVVESGVTLTISNSTPYFFSNGYVEVKKGGRLIIDNSHLTRCGSVNWQGIKAYTDNRSGPEGEIIIRNGSRIENAAVGLAVGRNSFYDFPLTKITITGENTIFIGNDIGISFNPGTTISTISNCNFFNRKYDINLIASSGLTIENSFFNQPIGSSYEFHAVNAFNSTFRLTGGNEFYRTGTGVFVSGSLPFSSGAQIGSANSVPNNFELGTFGIFSLNFTGLGFTTFPAKSNIQNNTFWANTFDAYGAGYNFVDVSENTFSNSGGVTFDATGNYSNSINCNTFNSSDIEFRNGNRNGEFLSNDFNGGSANVKLTSATVRSIMGFEENPAGNCFFGSNNNVSVDNASTSFNYFYKNVDCQNPSGSGFNKEASPNDPDNGCSNGRSPFPSIDPDGDGELGLAEASYNADNVCKPCILDSIALWVNNLTSLGGDNLYTVAEESTASPTEAQLRAERILAEWINYGAFVALNKADYAFAMDILTPLKKWEYQSQLFGVIMLKRDYSGAELFLENMPENNLNEAYFKYIQGINLKIYTNPSDSTAEVTDLILDSLETIALSTYPVKGYAASLHYFITGEDIVLEKLLEEEKATEKKEESLVVSATNNRSEFSVFPNPANDHLTIKTETELTSLAVYDLNGKDWILNRTGNLQTIDISMLPKGLYLLKATNESGKLFNVKFIKQ